MRRVTLRLIPFVFVLYIFNFLDRSNVGLAALQMNRDLGFSAAAFSVGAGIFFIGYALFEVPSNLVLVRVGARKWVARIMITWGLLASALMFVRTPTQFYVLRFLLGVAEAGFFPGMVLFLTYWIPASERARTGALFMMAAPIAIIVGAPISEMLLALDGRGGLAGWQWLFLGEGFPAVILGLLALRVLTDRPDQAHWLPPREREWLARTMEAERAGRASHGHASVLGGMRSPRVWLLCAVYFLNTVVTYGVFLWLPKILRDLSGHGGWRLSLMTAIPFVAALAGMVLIGRHSDRTGERKRHVAACALTAASGLVLAAFFTNNLPMLVLSFTLSQIGQRSVMSVFWSIPPMLLGGTAAAAGIALINAIGNLGGFVGPSIMGWLRDATGGYGGGLLVLSGALVLEAILVLSLRLEPARPAR